MLKTPKTLSSLAFGFFFLCSGFVFSGEEVWIPEGPSGYLSLPGQSYEKNFPAILLIHEWWGLNEHIRGLADQLADEGYAAFAVDLYRGHVARDPAEAHELMRGLPDDRALNDLTKSLTYLAQHSAINKKKIGVIGWCMGGGWALKVGLEVPRDVRSVVMYYGKVVTDDKKLSKLRAPLLGIFGTEDRGIPEQMVRDFEFRLEQLGKRAEIHLYENAGHAFANPANPGYRKRDAEDAWRKTLIFLKANLT